MVLVIAVLALESAQSLSAGKGTGREEGELKTPVRLLENVIVSRIDAGGSHTCAVTSGGNNVECWGWNAYGQIGNGTSGNQYTKPVAVSGLAITVTAIAGGAFHNCVLTSEGGVKCWGYNNRGALGDGTTTSRPTPVDVSGLTSGVTAIAAGGDTISGGGERACGLTSGGGLKCWGYNAFGELGDGTTISSSIPVTVSGLTTGVTAIATGGYHSCALTASGVKCWGNNGSGQLGNGTTDDSLIPTDTIGLTSTVTALAAGGSHACALTSGGGVQCWGSDYFGQLGDGATLTNRTSAVNVIGLDSGVTAITTGYAHTCALTSGGGVKCWGYNVDGQLGDSTNTDSSTPIDVVGLSSGVIAISAGDLHTCALTSGGKVNCWGENNNGQLGDGTTSNRAIPVGVLFERIYLPVVLKGY
ncbi:MAG: chromosome condensation regulator RCC1 [Dehalococcoidia bacterium]|nr:chromosome condensation regulator RCC1 [Dehalococcoidia bacterium]